MKNIYLASPWICREQTRAIRSELIDLGYGVTSRWLDVPDGPPVPDEFRGRTEAAMDLFDIDAADSIIVLTDERPVGAGHHVELGYAIATGKRIIVVGPVKSIFHYLAHERFGDWPSARSALSLPAHPSLDNGEGDDA